MVSIDKDNCTYKIKIPRIFTKPLGIATLILTSEMRFATPRGFRQDNVTDVSGLAQARRDGPRGLRCLEVRCWWQFGRSTSRWRDGARLGGTYNILELNLPCGLAATRGVCLGRVCEPSVLPLSRDNYGRTDPFVRVPYIHPRIHSHSP